MNNFVEGPKSPSQYSMSMRRWFLHFLDALFWKKWKFKFFLASLKTRTNFEDPYWNPLQNACCCIQEAAWDSVSDGEKFKKKFEAGFGVTFQIHRQMICCRLFQKLNWGLQFFFEMPPELEILMRLPVKSPELVSVFIEASRNFEKVFSPQLRCKKY
jgi:hypothetical protein